MPHQFDPPAGAADAVMGKRRRRRGGEAPAGCRSGRSEQRIGIHFLPVAKQQGRCFALLSGELETAGGGHFGALHFADHSGEAAVAHAFLHHRQHLFVIAAIGVKEAIGLEPDLGKRRGEEIPAGESPEHLALITGKTDSGGGEKERGDGIIAGRRRGRRRLMQRHRQAAADEPVIDRSDAERDARRHAGGSAGPLEGANLDAQGGEAWIRGRRHVTRTHMFLICSSCIQSESSYERGGALDIVPPLAQKAA